VWRFQVSCACCGKAWVLESSLSEYEQQTLESRPCPDCGGYALCCYPPAENRATPLARRKSRLGKPLLASATRVGL